MSSANSFTALSREVPNRVLGLSVREWVPLLFVSLVSALIAAPWYIETTLWAGWGLFLTMMVIGHLCLVGNQYVAFPGLVAFSACVAWVVAPWLSNLLPPSFPQYQMAVPLDEYLKYAVPATASLWLGLHWPLLRTVRHPLDSPVVSPLSLRQRRILDGVILAGLAVAALSDRFPAGLAFLGYILASFRFFGALCWMLTRTPGWTLRVAIVLVHLMSKATEEGVFYQVVHWVGYFVLIYGFRRRWRWALGLTLIAAVLGLALLQGVKKEYRYYIATNEVSGSLDRFMKLGHLMGARIVGSGEEEFEDSPGDVLVRFNQGWIISRIMDRVPRDVPYARGETVLDAAIYSIVPRALFPEKPEGASTSLFARFTGIQLGPWTTMGLSVIGELYANFGAWGGVAMTFVYAWIIGFLFSRFLNLSHRSTLWWAVTPLVLLSAVEPGWNIEDIWNHILKSGIVVFLLLWGVPPLRRLVALGTTAATQPKAQVWRVAKSPQLK